jgi:hypothetical protein
MTHVMIRADETHPAPAAELVRRPGLRSGAGDNHDPGPELLPGGSGIVVGHRASRRDGLGALGLLLGILGVLLVVAMTVGAAPPV